MENNNLNFQIGDLRYREGRHLSALVLQNSFEFEENNEGATFLGPRWEITLHGPGFNFYSPSQYALVDRAITSANLFQYIEQDISPNSYFVFRNHLKKTVDLIDFMRATYSVNLSFCNDEFLRNLRRQHNVGKNS